MGSQRVGHDWTTNTCIYSFSFQWNQFSFQSQRVNAKDCSNYHTITLISHSSKVMLQILQARLEQYVNWELPDVRAEFRKGRGTRAQIANIHWIIEKAREFQKNIGLLLYWLCKNLWLREANKLRKILKEVGISDHHTCPLRNLYTGQETIVRIRHETTGRFQTGKGVCQGCLLSPCLFKLYADSVHSLSRVQLCDPMNCNIPGFPVLHQLP